jgi:hypothetical protein
MERFKEYETVAYHVTYGELIAAARRRGTVTYQELALAAGLATYGSNMGRVIGELLGAVSQNEALNGRPMLSAIATNAQGRVSEGFFVLARQLGQLSESASPEEQQAYVDAQRRAIYDLWKQTYYTPKKS